MKIKALTQASNVQIVSICVQKFWVRFQSYVFKTNGLGWKSEKSEKPDPPTFILFVSISCLWAMKIRLGKTPWWWHTRPWYETEGAHSTSVLHFWVVFHTNLNKRSSGLCSLCIVASSLYNLWTLTRVLCSLQIVLAQCRNGRKI